MSLLPSFIARRFSGAASSGEASQDGALPRPALTCDTPTAPSNAPTTPPDDEADEIVSTTADDNAVPAALNNRPTLIDRFRRYSSFTRPSQDAVVVEEDEDCDDPSSTLTTAPIPIPGSTSMSRESSHVPELSRRIHQVTLDPGLSSAPSSIPIPSNRNISVVQDGAALSESLPADDGMAHLRARIHEIRDMKISDQERARMVHGLMTERYNLMRPTSPSSFVSHDRPFTPNSGYSVFSEIQASSPISAASDVDPENPYNLRPGDTDPTFRPHVEGHAEHGEEEEDEHAEGELVLGCQHYKRNVKVQCFDCRRWYTCRHCHDAVESHNLNRKMTQNMLCMACGTPQKASDHCEVCETEAACYYCDICKLWDNNSKKKIYHCPDCGICRRGEGLGKDFYHCKVSTHDT